MKDDRSPAKLAHVRQDKHGNWYEHRLEEHLRAVGEMAAGYASTFDASSWARLAGVWHDLGKYSAEFQRYIRSASGYERGEAHIEGAPGKVNHFKHDNELGNAPAHSLLGRVAARRRDTDAVPRGFEDYVVSADGAEMPVGAQASPAAGVTLMRLA